MRTKFLLKNHKAYVNTLGIYEEGNFFLSGGDENLAYLHSTRTGHVVRTYDFLLPGYDNILFLKKNS